MVMIRVRTWLKLGLGRVRGSDLGLGSVLGSKLLSSVGSRVRVGVRLRVRLRAGLMVRVRGQRVRARFIVRVEGQAPLILQAWRLFVNAGLYLRASNPARWINWSGCVSPCHLLA